MANKATIDALNSALSGLVNKGKRLMKSAETIGQELTAGQEEYAAKIEVVQKDLVELQRRADNWIREKQAQFKEAKSKVNENQAAQRSLEEEIAEETEKMNKKPKGKRKK